MDKDLNASLEAVPPLADWGLRWAQCQQEVAVKRRAASTTAKGFGERTAQLYLARWSAFAQYLAQEQLRADQIDQEVLTKFVASRRVRAANRPALGSLVTRARYETNILTILRFAQDLDWYKQINEPAHALMERQFSKDSLIITPQLLTQVCKSIPLLCKSFAQCRDALILHFVAVEALTVQDICHLRRGAVQWDASGHQARLLLTGPRKAQQRSIALHPAALPLLYQWEKWLEMEPLSERLIRSLPNKSTITAPTIYTVCASAIREALGEHQQELLPMHVGPNTLRNARLVAWLEQGMDRQNIALRAGLQRSELLDRLDHRFTYVQEKW